MELTSACRTLSSSDMHDNDQRVDQVYTLLAQYEDRLIAGTNYNKLRLACRQILGLRQLLNCTGYDRIVFASGQIDQAIKGEEINRDSGYDYKYPDKNLGVTFPRFNIGLIQARVGLGFDFYVSIYGAPVRARCCTVLLKLGESDFKIYVKQKHQACNRTLCSSDQSTIRQGV